MGYHPSQEIRDSSLPSVYQLYATIREADSPVRMVWESGPFLDRSMVQPIYQQAKRC
jgi:hypothetical protein